MHLWSHPWAKPVLALLGVLGLGAYVLIANSHHAPVAGGPGSTSAPRSRATSGPGTTDTTQPSGEPTAPGSGAPIPVTTPGGPGTSTAISGAATPTDGGILTYNGDRGVPTLSAQQQQAQDSRDTKATTGAAAATSAAQTFIATLQDYPTFPTLAAWQAALKPLATTPFISRLGSGAPVPDTVVSTLKANHLAIKTSASCYPNGWVLTTADVSVNCSFTVATINPDGSTASTDQIAAWSDQSGVDWPYDATSQTVAYMLSKAASGWVVSGNGNQS